MNVYKDKENNIKYFNSNNYDPDLEECYQENQQLPLYEYSGSAVNFLDQPNTNNKINITNNISKINKINNTNNISKTNYTIKTNNLNTNTRPYSSVQNLKIKLNFEVNGQEICEYLNPKESILDFANKLSLKYSIQVENIIQNIFRSTDYENNLNNNKNSSNTKPRFTYNNYNKEERQQMENYINADNEDNEVNEDKEDDEYSYKINQNFNYIESTDNLLFLDSERTTPFNSNNKLSNKNTPPNASVSTIRPNLNLNNNNCLGSGGSTNRLISNLDSTRNQNNKKIERNQKNSGLGLGGSGLGTGSNTNNSLNIGDRLFHKGIASKNRSMSRTKVKSNTMEDELKKCTFSPKINKKSAMMSIESKYNKVIPKYQHYTKSEEVKSDRNEYEQNEHNANTMEDYYIESNKPAHTGGGVTWRTEKLYKDHEKFKANKDKYREFYYSHKYNFSPMINDKTPTNINRFYDRLQNWVEKRNDKYLKELDSANYDTRTGVRLFSPKINKYKPAKHTTITNINTQPNKENTVIVINKDTVTNTQVNLKSEFKTVQTLTNTILNTQTNTQVNYKHNKQDSKHDFKKTDFKTDNKKTDFKTENKTDNKTVNRFTTLSSTWKITKERQNKLKSEQEKEQLKKCNEKKISKTSEDLTKEVHKKIFTTLFKQLDYENKNNIGGSIDLNLVDLPTNIKDIISPLLEELAEEGESLTLEEFVLACDDLYKALPHTDQSILTQYYFSISKIKKEIEYKSSLECSFKPKINPKSVKIFNESGGITENFFKSKWTSNSNDSTDKFKVEVHNFHNQKSKTNIQEETITYQQHLTRNSRFTNEEAKENDNEN